MKLSRLLLHLCWVLPAATLALYVVNPAGVPSWDPRGRLLGIIPYRIPANSMAPTFPKGSLVFACTWSYFRATPERGDVIVFRPPHDRATSYLKRVVGLEGEAVRLKDGKLFIDGVPQGEPYTYPNDSLRPMRTERRTQRSFLRLPAMRFAGQRWSWRHSSARNFGLRGAPAREQHLACRRPLSRPF